MAKYDQLGKVAALTVAGAFCGALPYSAVAADSLEAALKESTTKLNLRPRYENVEVDSGTSEALTLKTRLTFTTGSFYDVSAVLEFDDVTSLKSVDYLDGTNGLSGPPIVDPEGTEVNQAFLSYKGLDSTDLSWGRQRIVLDNQRFIGGVAWRQNEQTYGSFAASNSSVENLKLFYGYIYNVNRIFGEQSAAGRHAHETHLVNVNYTIGGIGSISGYYYDIDNQDVAGLSNATMGVRFAGATDLSSVKLGYELEYADQQESGDAPDYSADYLLASISGTMSGFTLGVAHEVLGADTDIGKGFTTSLATLHKFQGWADKFLGTPGTGIEDTYITFKAGLPMGMSFTAVFHDFESAEDTGTMGSDFGSEIDVSLAKKFSNGASVLLKYADFSGEEGAAFANARSDVTKIWIMANYAI